MPGRELNLNRTVNKEVTMQQGQLHLLSIRQVVSGFATEMWHCHIRYLSRLAPLFTRRSCAFAVKYARNSRDGLWGNKNNNLSQYCGPESQNIEHHSNISTWHRCSLNNRKTDVLNTLKGVRQLSRRTNTGEPCIPTLTMCSKKASVNKSAAKAEKKFPEV
jgi:hypothetical protein